VLNPATGAQAPQHSFTAGSHVVLEITFAPGCGPAVVFCLSPRPMELREVRACVLQQGLVLCHSVGIRRKVRGKIEGRDIDVLQVIRCQCEKESTCALAARMCACLCACLCACACLCLYACVRAFVLVLCSVRQTTICGHHQTLSLAL